MSDWITKYEKPKVKVWFTEKEKSDVDIAINQENEWWK